LLLAGASALGQTTSVKPDAIAAMESNRRALVSGMVEWRVVRGDNEGDFVRHVCRYAKNGDLIHEMRGNAQGFTLGRLKYPQLHLKNGAGWWYNQETSLSAQYWAGLEGEPTWAERMLDFRSAGLGPSSMVMRATDGCLTYGLRPDGLTPLEIIRWEHQRQGGKHVVTAVAANGETVTWTIDPQRGWNPERVERVGTEGSVIEAAVSTLRQFDGVWLPERTDYFEFGKLTESVRITRAELNRPGDAAALTLTDLGCEPGTNVGFQNTTEPGPNYVRFWDGGAVVTREEWDRLVEQGKRSWGPRFQAMFRGELPPSPYETEDAPAAREIAAKKRAVGDVLGRHRGLWEQYVRDFIKRYQLQDSQVEQAQQILSRCQQDAEDRTRRERAAFVPLWTEWQSVGEQLEPRKAERLEKLGDEISEAVNRVFKEELQPRLEKIPTRAQRKAAEEAGTTTSPAKKD
jgi:hypothetical protein